MSPAKEQVPEQASDTLKPCGYMCTVGEADQLHTYCIDGDYLVVVYLRPENQHFPTLLMMS